MKRGWVVLVLLFLGCLMLTSAQAASGIDERFYVTYGEAISYDGVQLNIVYPYVVRDKVYLFLPAAWDADKLTYVSQNDMTYYVGDAPLISGGSTDAFLPGKTVTLVNEKHKQVMQIKVMQGANIPAIFLINESGNLNRINKDKHIEETGGMAMLKANGDVITERLTQLRGRGNNTAGYPKEGYQIKLDKKKDLLDSGKSKIYILLADYLDYSLLRNRITLDMAAHVGLKNPLNCQTVDLYADGKYIGVYLLTEKAQIHSARINITSLEDATLAVNHNDLSGAETFNETIDKSMMIKGYQIAQNPEDITGGYLLEIEKAYRFRDNETNGFVTQRNQSVVVKEPSQASKAQLMYISELFNDFHNAINDKNGIDPRSGKHYTEIADLDSLCIKFWIEEISRNPDANASSQFFYKDSDHVDGLIYAGPVWDYDLAYGNSKIVSVAPNGGYLMEQNRAQYIYCNLYKQADFKLRSTELYFERMQPALDILTGAAPAPKDSPLKSIDAYREEIEQSAMMNGILWTPKVEGLNRSAALSFDNGVKFLKTYLTRRGAFLTKTLSK